MSSEKIFEDASQSATLMYGAKSLSYPTLQEAIIAWGNLPDEEKSLAVIEVGGSRRRYSADGISRLHHQDPTSLSIEKLNSSNDE
jgi:hypothetical protein